MNKNRNPSDNYNEHSDSQDEENNYSEDSENYEKFENFRQMSSNSNKNQDESNKNFENQGDKAESSEEETEQTKPRTQNKKSTIGVHHSHNIEKLNQNTEDDQDESEDGEEITITKTKLDTNKNMKLPKFDISQFSNINVGASIKELLNIMKKFEAKEVPIDTKLKPFLPSFIPSIGEVDAFLKMNRPDNQIEELGSIIIDEPIVNGIDPSIFSLELSYKLKLKTTNYNIKCIEEAEKHPKKIQTWIDQISVLHKEKVSSSVNYTKAMPNIETLMQIWPEEFEESLKGVNLPDEKINLNLELYAGLVCNMLDIPVHKLNSNKSIVEALHMFFSLYSEFKDNQHFQMQNHKKGEDNIQTKKFY